MTLLSAEIFMVNVTLQFLSKNGGTGYWVGTFQLVPSNSSDLLRVMDRPQQEDLYGVL